VASVLRTHAWLDDKPSLINHFTSFPLFIFATSLHSSSFLHYSFNFYSGDMSHFPYPFSPLLSTLPLSSIILSIFSTLETCRCTTHHYATWRSPCIPHFFRPSHWTIELCSLHRLAISRGLHMSIASRLLPAPR
jgi:hypothetical protein